MPIPGAIIQKCRKRNAEEKKRNKRTNVEWILDFGDPQSKTQTNHL